MDIVAIVQREVEAYAGGEWFKAKVYTAVDTAQQHYVVVLVPDRDYPVDVATRIELMVRIVGDVVVVERDMSDKPFWKDLIAAGVPREQIVLPYAGETPPDRES